MNSADEQVAISTFWKTFARRCMSLRSHLALTIFTNAAVFVLGSPSLADERREPSYIREVVRHSIPFIERSEADWIATKGCVSCHHTAFAVWSLNAAKKSGVTVDQAKCEELNKWSADWRNLVDPTVRAEAKHDETVLGHNDAAAQLLLARDAQELGAIQLQEIADYASRLVGSQQADGSWTPGGQLPLQKRPKRETQEVSTMWALLALNTSKQQDITMKPIVEKARAWLGDKTTGESTEWWATKLMLERKLGTAAKAEHLRAELLKRQRSDGGWGWLSNEDSDALGTGIGLYSLAEDKLPSTDPSIVKARQFLARTQAADGSWPVHGTKQNKKDRVEPTATFWGTCWAVIGLCKTLDD